MSNQSLCPNGRPVFALTISITTETRDARPMTEMMFCAGSDRRRSRMVALRESTSLIAADKVAGTQVYNSAGGKVGEIYDVMIDKKSGNVAYAIMSFGGFLGMGNDYHPLPWPML